MTGMIYTFYSYKGGVGRSMALANIGMYFYKQGFTTLLVDWDLEAPGLERYYEEHFDLNLTEIANRPGLCDMIQQYMSNASQPLTDNEDLPYPHLEDYLYSVDTNDKHQLLLMHAGRRAEGKSWEKYASFVQTFDWTDFYEKWEGGIYFEWLRNRFKEIADVILIDSRTGVTEMGGVATQHLADVVVLICGANLQNIDNTARMARNFLSETVKKARNERKLDIIITPSRVDDADSEGYGEFLDRFSEEFNNIHVPALNDGYSAIEMLIPYLPAFSYQELIIFDNLDTEKKARRLLESYKRIAANMQLLAFNDTSLKTGSSVTRATKPSVYIVHANQDKQDADEIVAYLEKNGVDVRRSIQSRVETSDADFTNDLNQVSCVAVLLTTATEASRFVNRVTYAAIDMGKPVIPVLLAAAHLPMSLITFQVLDLINNRNKKLNHLLGAISRFTSQDTTESIANDSSNPIVFISYADQDQKTAKSIYDALSPKGFNIWLTSRNVPPGEQWDLAVQSAIEKAVAVVPLISSESSKSLQVKSEWAYASKLEKTLFPIALDDEPVPLLFDSIEILNGRQNLNRALDLLIQKLQPPELVSQNIINDENLPIPKVSETISNTTSFSLQSAPRKNSNSMEFRQQEVGYIMERWRAGECCSLIGVGGVGKTTLLQHLENPTLQSYYMKDVAGGKPFKAILIDPHMLTPVSRTSADSEQKLIWAGYELMMHRLYLSLYPFQMFTANDAQVFYDTYQALQETENTAMSLRYFELALEIPLKNGFQIVFMFDAFEDFLKILPIQFFHSLRGLHDANNRRLSYLTVSRTSLANAVQSLGITSQNIEPFVELFSTNIVYVGPYSDVDARNMIQDLMRRNNVRYENYAIDFLLWSTGRYAGIMQAGFRALDSLSSLDSNTVMTRSEQLVYELLSKRAVRLECKTIWESLSDEEHKMLIEFMSVQPNIDPNKNEIQQVFATLQQKQLLKVQGNRVYVDPPVFQAFIKGQTNKITE